MSAISTRGKGYIESGLPAVGPVAWGTHLCHFYRSPEDLGDVVVPYFRAGLEEGEQCLWVTSEPFKAREARRALARVVPDLRALERGGQIEILDYEDWYAGVDADQLLTQWLEREEQALAQGYTGLRITGNTFWLQRDAWDSFIDYEAAVHERFRGRRILALCSYSLDRCGIDDVLEVLRNHSFALLRRDGAWDVVRSATELIGSVQAPERSSPTHSDDEDQSYERQRVADAFARELVRRRDLEAELERLVGIERATADRLSRLQRITSALTQAQSFPDLQRIIEEDMCSALGATHALIVEANATSESFRVVGHIGIPESIIQRYIASSHQEDLPSADAYHGGASLCLSTPSEIHARYPRLPTTARAIASVPMSAGRRLRGVITFGFPDEQAFDAAERALINDVVQQVSATLERVRLYDDAERERRRAEAANRAKDHFLAMLGHELRNPLAAIRNAASLLGVMDEQDVKPDELHWTRGVLERQTSHMAKLLDGLLDVSRIARGKIHIDREPVDLARIVRDGLHDRRLSIAQQGLELDTRLNGPCWVEGDAVRLAQVFDNLLSNALNFTRPPGRISVHVGVEGSEAILCVGDTGTGIEAGLLPHLFEPFWQASQELARTSGGLGLGLAVVKGLVELHGGEVTLDSAGKGKGTRAQVRIPRARIHGRNSSDDVVGAIGTARVLLVEDHTDSAALLRKRLELYGHEVAVACTAEQGLGILRAFSPDVLLCDIGLPGMTGYDLARAIRATPELQGARLIALTGYGRPEEARRAREAGFHVHLTKPADPADIHRLLVRCASVG